MLLRMLKAKIHLATVTSGDLEYPGSITIDADLLDAAGLLVHEQVLVANCANGERAETYVIAGPRGSGAMQLNGAMARMALPGDRVIVMAFAFVEPLEAPDWHPKIVLVDSSNRVTEVRHA